MSAPEPDKLLRLLGLNGLANPHEIVGAFETLGRQYGNKMGPILHSPATRDEEIAKSYNEADWDFSTEVLQRALTGALQLLTPDQRERWFASMGQDIRRWRRNSQALNEFVFLDREPGLLGPQAREAVGVLLRHPEVATLHITLLANSGEEPAASFLNMPSAPSDEDWHDPGGYDVAAWRADRVGADSWDAEPHIEAALRRLRAAMDAEGWLEQVKHRYHVGQWFLLEACDVDAFLALY